MKILHLSDLHIGKRVNEFPMIDDQKYILNQILHIAEEQKVDVIAIAGDIYDKSIPSADAVELLDEFLSSIARLNIVCFIVSGNHDSAERIAYGARIMNERGIHLSKVFHGNIEKVTLQDEFGDFNVYLLPFIKPIHVKQFYPDAEIQSYEEAVRFIIEKCDIDLNQRNMVLAHQFFSNGGQLPELSDSETVSVGGIDNVDVSVLNGFDYAALGHIHKPQVVGTELFRYCGSPLKYSFSEAKHEKCALVITFEEKGSTQIDRIPLIPKRDLREIKGPIDKLLSPEIYEQVNRDDYIHVTLTDEDEIIDAIGRVRAIYPNVMRLDFDNNRTRSINAVNAAENVADKTPLELFKEFYEMQNGVPLDQEKEDIVRNLFVLPGGEQH